jgi:mono/diheme cytochrome c family protein
MKTPNSRIRKAARLLSGLALLTEVFAATGAKAQVPEPSGQQFQQLIHSVEGPDLFRAYCASCHGTDAKGHGPAAPALKSNVPDLTNLAKNNGGQFPSALVRETINGDAMVFSHGSREMPIWGPVFHQVEADVDLGNERVENLVKYLGSLQSVAPPDATLGAELYKRHCVSCHGSDLKGNVPAPPAPYRMPPDLTTLARRHGGKFPDDDVSNALRNGVVMPAHGPAQMPVWGIDFKAREIAGLTDYIKSVQAK